MLQIRVVTKDREVDVDMPELDISSTDAQILSAVERRMEQELKGYVVSKSEDKVLVSPSPVFG